MNICAFSCIIHLDANGYRYYKLEDALEFITGLLVKDVRNIYTNITNCVKADYWGTQTTIHNPCIHCVFVFE